MTAADYNRSVRQYADRLYRFALSMVSNSMDAEDIVQGVFERLWVKVDDVQPGSVKSYLFTSVYRSSIDVLRKRKFTSIENNEYWSVPSVEKQVEVKEVLNLVLHELNEDQKAMILLCDYEGYAYKEIAELMDISLPQVKINLYRARKKLQQIIKSLEVVL